jgi:hypothetical protein
MRITRPLTYQSMLQDAGKGGCVICALLKSYQSALLERLNPAELKAVCNYHGWSIAAAAQARIAAQTFFHLLEKAEDASGETDCDFCVLIRKEEESRLKELGRVLGEPEVLDWMQAHNALCLPHAKRLVHARSSAMLAIAVTSRERLKNSLQSFLAELTRNVNSGGGILGRAAEFLFGFRGMPRH